MSVIIGLGNIGREYEGTRHNIGFELVNRIADALSLEFEQARGPYRAAQGRYKGKPIILLKPNTLMNRSGAAVTKAVVEFKTELKNCLICYDDLNLPAGKIRFRDSGSAGGHNGIKDIITRAGTRDFPRMRFGIGQDFPRGKQVDYVLERFSADQQEDIAAGLEKAEEGVYCFVRQGIVHTMNQFN